MQKILALFFILLTAVAAGEHSQRMVQGQTIEVKKAKTNVESEAETGRRRLTENHSHHQTMVQGKEVEEHKARDTADASSGGRRRLTEEQDGSANAGSGGETEPRRTAASSHHQIMVQGKMVEVEKAKTNVESEAEAGRRRLTETHSHHQTMVQGKALEEPKTPRRGLTPRAKSV